MKLSLLLLIVVNIICASAYADTLILTHGYLGSAKQWRHAGIVEQLDKSGWHNAGELKIVDKVVKAKSVTISTPRRLYSLNLQSEKSIADQTLQLHQYIEYIRQQHFGEQIILVGHSVGGVVARLYLVEHAKNDLIALITIASPHLGTDKAEFVGLLSQGVFAWLEPIPGINTLYESQGLFFDLIPNRSDNLIGWLNHQQHPSAQYFSIVRKENDSSTVADIMLQDFIVPVWSQDMNEVFALRGRSKTYQVGKMHGLSKDDGEILQKILISLYSI